MRSILVFAASVLASGYISGQSAPTETESLQSLVKEVRLLRQELVTTTAAAQRVQIVLYRLQGQQAALQKASEKYDTYRERVSDTEAQIKRVSNELQQAEDHLSRIQSETDRKELQEQVLPHLKSELERLRDLKQQQQVAESQAEGQLHGEQAKLNDLENFLERLDKSLADLDHSSTPR
jgi:chromosome segregation ATPase